MVNRPAPLPELSPEARKAANERYIAEYAAAWAATSPTERELASLENKRRRARPLSPPAGPSAEGGLTAYISIFEQGHKVADLTVHIDAASRVVRLEDKDGKRHACTDTRAAEILDGIRKFDRDKRRELEHHSLEGAI